MGRPRIGRRDRSELFQLRLPQSYRKRLAVIQKRNEHLSSLTSVILFVLDRGLTALEQESDG